MFSGLTKLTLTINNNFSNDSIDYLSTLIDLRKLDTLSLTLDLFLESFMNILSNFNNLLSRTCNVKSINLRFANVALRKFIEYIETVCPVLPCQVKHLTIDMDHKISIQTILDRFENFSSVTFRSTIKLSIEFDNIIEEFKQKERDFVYRKNLNYVSFWFGK